MEKTPQEKTRNFVNNLPPELAEKIISRMDEPELLPFEGDTPTMAPGTPPKEHIPKRQSILPATHQMTAWQIEKDQALKFFKSGCLPRSVDSPEKAITIMQAGKEIGLQPMESFRGINLIEGKISMSSELMLSLFLRRVAGAKVKWLTPKEKAHERCEIELSREGHEPQKFEFTIEDAKRAGLLSKTNWQKYPAPQLRARALSAGIRAYAPDAMLGVATEGELDHAD